MIPIMDKTLQGKVQHLSRASPSGDGQPSSREFCSGAKCEDLLQLPLPWRGGYSQTNADYGKGKVNYSAGTLLGG